MRFVKHLIRIIFIVITSYFYDSSLLEMPIFTDKFDFNALIKYNIYEDVKDIFISKILFNT